MTSVKKNDSSLLFFSDTSYAVIDVKTNSVVSTGGLKTFSDMSSYTVTDLADVDPATLELAEAAMTSLNIETTFSTDRMHTIPKSVQAEAKRALDWKKEFNRGGTPVGENTARTLAKGGQIGIKKIRHIAKYFPRHEVDKKGKGYKIGEDGYPSRGRIAWGLWGGEAAKKWATAIVERENKKSITASFDMFEEPSTVELSDFSKETVQFVVRVRKSGAFDRLYKVDFSGDVSVWDDGCWDSLGNLENDIDTYDAALDSPYDKEEKRHVPVDPQTAVTIAALFDSAPFSEITQPMVSSVEWDLFANAKHELDWDNLKSVTAAGDVDGNYTPEERSENVKSQVRDAKGRFAEKGGRVVINGNQATRGVIQDINEEAKTATVKMDSGETIEVPVKKTEKEDPKKPVPPPAAEVTPVDTSGILGETKKTTDKSIAQLPEKLPVLSKEDLHKIISEFPEQVQKKRDKARIDALTSSAEKPAKDAYKEPQESDIDPLYFAIVADDDPQAVMDVVALVPEGPETSAPMTFKRSPNKWERDDSILADLNSPTPPPVVQLDLGTLEEVLNQVDSAVTSSGVIDIKNAERLRQYWAHGKGSEKILWKNDGSWERCVNSMSKFMGPMAKSYCAFMHKEVTGGWVGTDKEFSIPSQSGREFNNYKILPEEEIIQNAINRARASDARERVLTAGGASVTDGSKFVIPLVIPEGVESGDGRIFDKESIDIRELPLPLLWQIKTGEGHNGSVVVGRIDYMEKTDQGIGNAYGYFDTGNYGKEAERLVRGGFIRGVSADLDKFEASEETEKSENSENEDISTGRMKISKARVMAVTLVPKPAFQECTIKIQEDTQEDEVLPDGVYIEEVDPIEASALVACGITAGVIPVNPPKDWFDKPSLKQATPLTVDDEGRVFGHIAAWHVDHIGMSFGTKPPRSRSKYSYFHTGVVRTEEGADVPVGQLTLAGGHASLEMNAQQAVRHYDDTASAIADVHAGEDAYGIWVAGALRPGTTPEQIRALRASAPSGDWRPIKGHLELVAVCQVNVPGFPIARARVASGQVMALVAAGASALAHMKSDPVAELNARIDRLERKPLQEAANTARSRVLSIKVEELSNKMKKTKKDIAGDTVSWDSEKYNGDTDPEEQEAEEDSEASVEELRSFDPKERDRLAKKGMALPDGSFPIENSRDLKNAIWAYGRSSKEKREEVKAHIIKRAKELGKEDMIPDIWEGDSSSFSDEEDIDEVSFAIRQRLDSVKTFLSSASNKLEENPCWDGYEMVGTKIKNGKEVPNCVPVNATIEEDSVVASVRERLAIVQAMVSAGGLDRNRGNAEKLRRYWTKGEGAAKIRWGTPGDWKRCVRYLSKYMGVRSKGYCQLRHKEATGVYTGSRLNPGRNNSIDSGKIAESENLESFYNDYEMIPTEVTDEDMSTPIEWLESEEDSDYDRDWEPEKEIIILCQSVGEFDTESLETSYSEFAPIEEEILNLTPEEIDALKAEKIARQNDLKVEKKGKYTAKTQPRDSAGKFRTVLARLKLDLGVAGLDSAIKKVEEIENLDFSGNYSSAAKASGDLIDIIDRLDTKALNPESLENVRASSAELGKVIANLPFAFGKDAQKVRFSDLPPALQDLMKDMITRVEKKIGPEDADIATKKLQTFLSGSDVFNQSEISAEMSKLLRLLT